MNGLLENDDTGLYLALKLLLIVLLEYTKSWTSSIFRTCPDSILQNVLICFALSSFFHGIVGGPYVSLLLSRVPANTKVVTFGLMHLGMKIIGYAPGPFFAGSAIGNSYGIAIVLIKKLVDSACIFWKTDGCGEKTSCQYYDNGRFRAGFTNLLVIPGLFTFPTYFYIVYKTYSKKPDRCPMYSHNQMEERKILNDNQ